MIETDEMARRERIPVFVNSYNQIAFLRDTLSWFNEHGFGNVTVMDNASTATELLAFFESDGFKAMAKLYQIGDNLWPRRAMRLALRDLEPDAAFIFTDPDLWLPNPPDPAFLSEMIEMGRKYHCPKVGCALDVSEPELFREMFISEGVGIVDWERRFWRRQVEPNVFRNRIDTTFFMHVPDSGAEQPLSAYGLRQARVPALRMAGPGFLAKHRPWYKDDGQPPEERAAYLGSASFVASWARMEQPKDPG